MTAHVKPLIFSFMITYRVFPAIYTRGICATTVYSFSDACKEASDYLKEFGLYCRIKKIKSL